MRLSGLSYGSSIAYPVHSPSFIAARDKREAEQAMQIAIGLYVEEWNAMSPCIRPAVVNISHDRAYRDGFITAKQYSVIKGE